MFFKNLCVLVLWTEVASALEGLSMINRLILVTELTEQQQSALIMRRFQGGEGGGENVGSCEIVWL